MNQIAKEISIGTWECGAERTIEKGEQMKKLLMVSVVILVFCSFVGLSYGEEKKVEIKDGIVYFPEDGLPTVTVAKLIQKFPSDCPQELLSIKGKIFRGELTRKVSHMTYTLITYLIPSGYNSDTKEMAFYIVQDKGYGKGYESKSVLGMLRGKFDAANGSSLHWLLGNGTTIMTQEYKLSFQKNGGLRVDKTDGFSGDYVPVASLPEQNQ